MNKSIQKNIDFLNYSNTKYALKLLTKGIDQVEFEFG